jgi:hypothetical protein
MRERTYKNQKIAQKRSAEKKLEERQQKTDGQS